MLISLHLFSLLLELFLQISPHSSMKFATHQYNFQLLRTCMLFWGLALTAEQEYLDVMASLHALLWGWWKVDSWATSTQKVRYFKGPLLLVNVLIWFKHVIYEVIIGTLLYTLNQNATPPCPFILTALNMHICVSMTSISDFAVFHDEPRVKDGLIIFVQAGEGGRDGAGRKNL